MYCTQTRGFAFQSFEQRERTHQLITQVAGRAGRGTEPGRVPIQTYSPEHYVMQAILKEDPEGFVRREMTERKEFGYPPFTHLAVVLIFHEDGEVALQKAQRVQEFLQGVVEHLKAERLYLFGPVFAPIHRLKTRLDCKFC